MYYSSAARLGRANGPAPTYAPCKAPRNAALPKGHLGPGLDASKCQAAPRSLAAALLLCIEMQEQSPDPYMPAVTPATCTMHGRPPWRRGPCSAARVKSRKCTSVRHTCGTHHVVPPTYAWVGGCFKQHAAVLAHCHRTPARVNTKWPACLPQALAAAGEDSPRPQFGLAPRRHGRRGRPMPAAEVWRPASRPVILCMHLCPSALVPLLRRRGQCPAPPFGP